MTLFWRRHVPSQESYTRQYRVAIYAGDAQQLAAAEASRVLIAASTRRPVATAIEPLTKFWIAENYHQKYSLRRHRELLDELHGYSPLELADSTVAARLNGYIAGHGTAEQLASELDSFGLSTAGRARITRIVADGPGPQGLARI